MKFIDDGVITKKEYSELTNDEKLNYWQIEGNKFKLISKLEDEHLQNAFCYAQTKELVYHNGYNLFNGLTEKIEIEAQGRGLSLKDIDTHFHRKTRKHKSKVSEKRKERSNT